MDPVQSRWSMRPWINRPGRERTSRPCAGTLTFLAGQINHRFRIPILDDRLCEGPEELGVQLRNLTGPATLGSSDCVVVIQDNDGPGLSFESASVVVKETLSELLLTVLRMDGGATRSRWTTRPWINRPGRERTTQPFQAR